MTSTTADDLDSRRTGSLDRTLDEEFARAILPEVSRTFALSINQLPPELSAAVRTAYLLCRIVDTIEDEPLDRLESELRAGLFGDFDACLANDGHSPAAFEAASIRLGLGADSPDARLCAQAGAVFRLFRALPEPQRQAIRAPVQEMSAGMREYCLGAGRAAYAPPEDVEDLERYCYFVAGTVGKLLTGLFEQHVPDLKDQGRLTVHANAVSFGVGLQLVNILKDVAEDAARGITFLPAASARGLGLDLNRILEPDQRAAAMSLIKELGQLARHHLGKAEAYTLAWPTTPQGQDVRKFCLMPLALALATLEEVRAGNDTLVAGKTPKVSRELVGRVMVDAAEAVASNEGIQGLLADLKGSAGGGA